MEKERRRQYLLAAIGGGLLVLTSFTRSFPIAIFGALAPLFALVDRRSYGPPAAAMAWAMCVLGAISWYHIQSGTAFPLLIQTVMVASVLGLYYFARKPLGQRFGVFTLALFWMAGEYLVLKIAPTEQYFFLADTLYEKTNWLDWTSMTGYLGASCWILLSNMFVYFSFLREGLQPKYVLLLLIVILGPIFYSYISSDAYLPRLDMISLYNDADSGADYATSGEWVARTAAWTSVLVVLSAFVKSKTQKS